jgi:hypothetical protein
VIIETIVTLSENDVRKALRTRGREERIDPTLGTTGSQSFSIVIHPPLSRTFVPDKNIFPACLPGDIRVQILLLEKSQRSTFDITIFTMLSVREIIGVQSVVNLRNK